MNTTEKTSSSAAATVSITLGADGRLYCHDITPDLLPVLSALCGVDAELARRQAACESLEERTP